MRVAGRKRGSHLNRGCEHVFLGMRVREVETHYVTVGEGYVEREGGGVPWGPVVPRQLPRSAKYFWEHCGLGEADKALVVTQDRKLVAFFRYSFIRPQQKSLVASGTWVAPSVRRKRIALELWRRVLRKYPVTRVDVVVATRDGNRLVRKLEKLFPKVTWDVFGNFG